MEIVIRSRTVTLTAGVPAPILPGTRCLSVLIESDDDFSIGDEQEQHGAFTSVSLDQVETSSSKIAHYDLSDVYVLPTVTGTFTIVFTEVKRVD